MCHALALAYVRSKIARSQLHPDRFGLSPSDIALDCIADLFRQDSDGCMVQITTYFEGINFEETSDTDLLSHLRRLVFSKVNQGLFHLYSEHDPGFGKILRNIKLSVNGLHNFVELEQFGEVCIVPALCDTLEHLPPALSENLESELHQRVKGDEHIPGLLSHLALYLRTQTDHSRIVGLNAVAGIFRSMYGRLRFPEPESTPAENRLLEDDIRRVVKEACSTLQKKSHRRYVKQKHVPLEIFQDYFRVIETGLLLKYVEQDGQDFSLYSGLRNLIPGLTRESYQKEHRSNLEYLLSLTEKKVVDLLKAE